MKLYNVQLVHNIVVRAKDEKSALSEANYALSECDKPDDYDVSIINNVSDLIPPWDGDCRPYGETDDWDRTILEQLKDVKTI